MPDAQTLDLAWALNVLPNPELNHGRPAPRTRNVNVHALPPCTPDFNVAWREWGSCCKRDMW
jgi:transposase